MSLREKASKVNFSALPNVGTPSDDQSPRPKTAPGAMMAFAHDQRSELIRENEALREQAGRTTELQAKLDESLLDLMQWNGAKATRLLDASDIRPSRFANRHDSSFQSAAFEQLKAEIRDAGCNVQPIKVRQVAGEGLDAKFEIVFGHRRWEACRQLGIQVSAVVDNVEDRVLFTEMDRENRARKDLSPWEQGAMYRRALDENLFPSNKKMAEALGVDLGALGRTLVLADLPPEVVAAFPSPLDLQFRWAKPLNDALERDRGAVLRRAKAIAGRTPRPSSKVVFAELLGQQGRGVEPFNPPPVVVDLGGAKATLSEARGGTGTLIFEAGALTPERKKALLALLESFRTI